VEEAEIITNHVESCQRAGLDEDAMKGWLTKIWQNWKAVISVASIKSDALRIERVKRYETFPSCIGRANDSFHFNDPIIVSHNGIAFSVIQ